MKKYLLPHIFAVAVSCVCCSQTTVGQAPVQPMRWDFDNLNGWATYSQDENPNPQIELNNGVMKIWTRQGSLDRKKAATIDRFTTGTYRWRTYVAQPGVGDRASVGSWLYCDDHHEIDFEVGYGKATDRAKYMAKEDEILAWMTTQDHPFSSEAYPIKAGWHDFQIDLSLVGGKYLVRWSIDGVERHRVQQTFGVEYAFKIYCSVENLNFVGDTPASQDNYGLFDWVSYTPN